LAKEGAKGGYINYFNSDKNIAGKQSRLIEQVGGECIVVRGDMT
jgi:hypothetical protein